MKGLIAFLLLLGCGCMRVTAAPWIAIEVGEHPHIRWLQDIMYKVVNTVVTEEVYDALVAVQSRYVRVPMSIIGLEKKKRLVLSVLYLTDDATNEIELADKVEAQLKKSSIASSEVFINHEGGWFGKEKDQLVVKIVDSTQVLHTLRVALTEAIEERFINNDFPFVPHVCLGQVRTKAIIDFVVRLTKISSDHDEIKTMMNRINKRLSEVVETIPLHPKMGPTIAVRGIDFFGAARVSVRKISLL